MAGLTLKNARDIRIAVTAASFEPASKQVGDPALRRFESRAMTSIPARQVFARISRSNELGSNLTLPHTNVADCPAAHGILRPLPLSVKTHNLAPCGATATASHA